MQTDIRVEIKKKKKNNWLSNKMTNEYIYIYIDITTYILRLFISDN